MVKRQTRIFVRSDEPLEDWAETLVGRVFGPISKEFGEDFEWFWFSRYGSTVGGDSADCDISRIPDEYKKELQPGVGPFHRSMRFRFCASDAAKCAEIEERARELIRKYAYCVSDFRDYDHVADTGGYRFLGIENRQSGRAEERAELTVKFYWSVSRLVVDALVGPDLNARFHFETSDDRNNNPRGSTFQSLLHLFCNITNVPTDVYVYRKSEISLLGFGTFMYPPTATPSGGWDKEVTACQIRF